MSASRQRKAGKQRGARLVGPGRRAARSATTSTSGSAGSAARAVGLAGAGFGPFAATARRGGGEGARASSDKMPKAGGTSTAMTAKKPKGAEKVVLDEDIE